MRCARIRAASSLDLLPFFLIGTILGFVVFTAAFMVTLSITAVPSGMGPFALVASALRNTQPARLALSATAFMLVVFFLPRFMRWMFERTLDQLTAKTLHKQRRWRTQAPRVFVVFAAVLAVLFCAASAFGTWQPVMIAAAKVVTGIGSVVIVTGLRSRRGVHTVCARCDYPMGSWRAASAQCPECGNAWKEPWRARFGQRGVNVRAVSIGLSCLVAAGLLLTALGVWGLSRP